MEYFRVTGSKTCAQAVGSSHERQWHEQAKTPQLQSEFGATASQTNRNSITDQPQLHNKLVVINNTRSR